MKPLDFDKNRFRVKFCPCGKSNRDGKFAPYLGYEDKGFCHSCGETFIPEITNIPKNESFTPPPPKPVSYIDPEILESSLRSYKENNFVTFLILKFGKSKAMEAVRKYKVGTSNRWQGANVFWQVDKDNKIRGGKIMLYNSSTGKRQNKNSWAHSALKLNDYNLSQCLFGEHLLESNPNLSVGIVESEKTAIIASILLPNFIWLASGGKEGLKTEKCQALKNRNVFLFPDLTKPGDKSNCFDLWSNCASKLNRNIPGALFIVSDYLESKASDEEKEKGFDIADYLLKWEWNHHNERNEGNEPITKPLLSDGNLENEGNELAEPLQKSFIPFKEYIEDLHFENGILINGNGYPAIFDTSKGDTLIDESTKKFIAMAEKQPLLLKMQEMFYLQRNL